MRPVRQVYRHRASPGRGVPGARLPSQLGRAVTEALRSCKAITVAVRTSLFPLPQAASQRVDAVPSLTARTWPDFRHAGSLATGVAPEGSACDWAPDLASGGSAVPSSAGVALRCFFRRAGFVAFPAAASSETGTSVPPTT